jgi:hypothetical protein
MSDDDLMPQIARYEPEEAKRIHNNPAGYARVRLIELINSFQANIPEDFEVGISVVGSGSAAPFRLREISVSNPDILILDGIDETENRVQLLQRHSQLAIMLVAMPKIGEKPFRVGFT